MRSVMDEEPWVMKEVDEVAVLVRRVTHSATVSMTSKRGVWET